MSFSLEGSLRHGRREGKDLSPSQFFPQEMAATLREAELRYSKLYSAEHVNVYLA